MRLKPQQYWAIILTLLFHTVLFWGLFFSQMSKNKQKDLYELELKEPEKKEQDKEQIRKIAEKQLQEQLSNKASKQLLKGEKVAKKVRLENDTRKLIKEFEERKKQFDALTKRQPKPKVRLQKEPSRLEENLQDSLSRETIFYVGNSRVEYFLAERYRRSLPIPAYKCEGAGSVEVLIWVNRAGQVTSAEIVKFRSKQASECMREAALKAAKTSLFSSSPNSPMSQKGRIVYLFAPQ